MEKQFNKEQMKRKKYLIYEQVFFNENFIYDENHQLFTSKDNAKLWIERKKIHLREKGYIINEKQTEKDEFAAKLGDITRWYNIILANY